MTLTAVEQLLSCASGWTTAVAMASAKITVNVFAILVSKQQTVQNQLKFLKQTTNKDLPSMELSGSTSSTIDQQTCQMTLTLNSPFLLLSHWISTLVPQLIVILMSSNMIWASRRPTTSSCLLNTSLAWTHLSLLWESMVYKTTTQFSTWSMFKLNLLLTVFNQWFFFLFLKV